MAFYVRKFARAKWNVLEKDSENIIENYNADTIANDMRTQGNTISLWRVESLSDQDIEPVLVINSLLGDTISKIDLLFIPEEMMGEYLLEQEDGDTVVSKYQHLHYNVVKLSVKAHILFAKNIVLKILEDEKTNKETQGQACLIKRIAEKKQFEMIEKWIAQGDIEFTQLKERQQSAIEKYREKAKKAKRAG